MTPTAYTVAAALAGALMMAATVFGLRFVDESFREHRWTCCVCRRTWVGTAKLCRCGARGHTEPPVPVVVPEPRAAMDDAARHRLKDTSQASTSTEASR